MPPKAPDVTAAELAVLKVLWAMGLATIREIRDDLYPGGSTSEYATVQKLLERLEAKQLVRRSREAVPHTFAAVIDREELVSRRAADLADVLGDGAIAPVVSNLVRSRKLSKDDRAQLRKLVDDVLRKGGDV